MTSNIGFQFRYLGYIICLFASFFAANLTAQSDSSSHLVKFTSHFKFRDGFYLNFEQVKNNKPIPKSLVITSINDNSESFFEQVIDSKTIKYIDDRGKNQEVDAIKLWGYCNDGIMHIRISYNFNKIAIMGNISLFSANITAFAYKPNITSSQYGNVPSGSNYIPYTTWQGGYIYSYGAPNYPISEMRQFLLDFNTGKLLEYKTNNVEMLLKTDTELHDEFARLRTRRKQQRQFIYIRKFNERNPLYLPK